MAKKTKSSQSGRPQGAFHVHDKVAWHYPEGKGCPSLAFGKRHIVYCLKLLGKHDLLSEEGRDELKQFKIGTDFSLTSDLLTPEADVLLAKYYDSWLTLINYGGPFHEDFWTGKLAKLKKPAIKKVRTKKPKAGKKKVALKKRK